MPVLRVPHYSVTCLVIRAADVLSAERSHPCCGDCHTLRISRVALPREDIPPPCARTQRHPAGKSSSPPVYVKVINAQIFDAKFVQNRMAQNAGFVLKKTITYDIIVRKYINMAFCACIFPAQLRPALLGGLLNDDHR